MTYIGFFAKLLVIFLLIKGLYFFCAKKLQKIFKIKGLFSENFRRKNLFTLATSDLIHAPFALILFAAIYYMTMQGYFIFQDAVDIHQGRGVGFFSTIVYWLTSTDIWGLLFCYALGLVIGICFLGFGFSVLLATVLLFPFFISTPGTALLIFGDLTAAWLITWRKHSFAGLWIRFIGTCIALIIFWVFGGVLKEMLANSNLNAFNPGDRSLQVFLLIVLLSGIDTLVSLLTLHYYFHQVIKHEGFLAFTRPKASFKNET